MSRNKIFGLLGIAAAARFILVGEKAMNSIRNQTAELVLIASDASEKTKKRVLDKCRFYDINSYIIEDSLQISNAIGKENIKFIAITDKGIALELVKNLK